MLLMRLQQKELTPQTLDAIKQISRFIAFLAHDFKLDEEEQLFKKED